MTEQVSKPKGWYGQEVARLSGEFTRILAEVEALRKELAANHELTKLGEHPMLINYSAFYDRFRLQETTMQNLIAKISHFESRIAGVEQAVKRLTAPERRGA